jgi:hypothetical protein
MTKKQWHEFAIMEWSRLSHDKVLIISVKDWPEQKEKVLTYLKNMDSLTEVYNMENKGE